MMRRLLSGAAAAATIPAAAVASVVCYNFDYVECCVGSACVNCTYCHESTSTVPAIYRRWFEVTGESGWTRTEAADQLCYTDYPCTTDRNHFAPCADPWRHCIPDTMFGIESHVPDWDIDEHCEDTGGGGGISS